MGKKWGKKCIYNGDNYFLVWFCSLNAIIDYYCKITPNVTCIIIIAVFLVHKDITILQLQQINPLLSPTS
jgi:hypothetical protein